MREGLIKGMSGILDLMSSVYYLYIIFLNPRRPLLKTDERPVASVRPLQSTPIPMMPRHMPVGHGGSASGSVPPFNFPVNYLQRAGVLVQKVVTTTGKYYITGLRFTVVSYS